MNLFSPIIPLHYLKLILLFVSQTLKVLKILYSRYVKISEPTDALEL